MNQHRNLTDSSVPMLARHRLVHVFRKFNGEKKKSQSSTARSDVGNGDTLLLRHKAKDGEDDEAGVETRSAVDDWNDDRVSVRTLYLRYLRDLIFIYSNHIGDIDIY